jgi:hypothetical protein
MKAKLNLHHFVLILDGVNENTPNLEDALFESGCDDGLINIRNNTVYIDFDRIAENLEEAIISAINDVEMAGINAKVVSVEPSTIVTISEIAHRCHLSRQAISLLVNEQRGDGTFPSPIGHVDKRSAFWKWSLVARWLYEHHKMSRQAVEDAETLELINGALSLRDGAALREKQTILKRIRHF